MSETNYLSKSPSPVSSVPWRNGQMPAEDAALLKTESGKEWVQGCWQYKSMAAREELAFPESAWKRFHLIIWYKAENRRCDGDRHVLSWGNSGEMKAAVRPKRMRLFWRLGVCGVGMITATWLMQLLDVTGAFPPESRYLFHSYIKYQWFIQSSHLFHY